MNARLRKILIYSLALILGLGLCVWLFRQQDLAALGETLAQTQWGWVLLALGLTLIGHWVRALRWKLLLEGAGRSTTAWEAFVALLGGYFVNLGLPRLGEVTRCVSLNRMNQAPVLTVLGTVVIERVVDMATLLLVLLGTFWVARGVFAEFIQKEIVLPLGSAFEGKFLLFAFAVVLLLSTVVVVFFLLKKKSANPNFLFFQRHLRNLKDGMVGLIKMKQKPLFLLYTLLIWLSYFSAPYLTLFALGLAPENALQIGFVAFSVGSIARTIPAPGGSMGAYHWLVMQSMVIFGFSLTEGLAIATLNHGVQTLFYLVFGTMAFYMMFRRGLRKK